MRWIEEDGHVSVYRSPSDYSNGNTFDYEGRQLSCQHGLRRVARFEPDGTTTVIADKWQGKPLNSPNDIVVHPDGSIWFTDPTLRHPGQSAKAFRATPENMKAVHRVDPKAKKMDIVTDEMDQPNGICFSPDYKKLYICDTGDPRDIQVFDIADGKASKKRRFVSAASKPGGAGLADGHSRRCGTEISGREWAAKAWGRRRPHIYAGWSTHREDRAAGNLREYRFWRDETQSAVYVRESVAVSLVYVGGIQRRPHRIGFAGQKARYQQ